MSEIPQLKPTSDVTWAEGPSPHGVTEPSAGEKQTGYYEGTGADDGEVLDAERLNWHLRETYRYIRWLTTSTVRGFAAVGEGIAATTAGQVFRVGLPDGQHREALQSAWQHNAGATISYWCTDASRVYFKKSGTSAIYAVDATTGSSGWSQTHSGVITGLGCDGRYVYVGTTTTLPEIRDPSDGSLVATLTGHSVYSASHFASNGAYLAYACGNDIYIHSDIGNTRAYDGSYAHGAAVQDVCMDQRNVILVSDPDNASGDDIAAVSLSTRTAQWTLGLEGSGYYAYAANCHCATTDGVVVYVGHDRVALSAGGYGSLDVVSADEGTILTTVDTGHDVCGIWPAGEYIYVGHYDGYLAVVGRDGKVCAKINLGAKCVWCDGVGMYGTSTTTTTDDTVGYYWLGRGSVMYDRTAADDTGRAPWSHMLCSIAS